MTRFYPGRTAPKVWGSFGNRNLKKPTTAVDLVAAVGIGVTFAIPTAPVLLVIFGIEIAAIWTGFLIVALVREARNHDGERTWAVTVADIWLCRFSRLMSRKPPARHLFGKYWRS